jgi:cyclopropane fatty-acyl-phospholipid synthase-like methyltransferase
MRVLASPEGARARLTCVDLDHEALVAGARRAEDLGVAGRVAFVHGNAVPSPDADEPAPPFSIGQQDAAYALGLLEYLSDDECVRVLDWAAGALRPGGAFAVHTLAAKSADRAFMDHILEWRVHHRSPAELAAIFARSRFTAAPRIDADASGAGLFAVVTKA